MPASTKCNIIDSSLLPSVFEALLTSKIIIKDDTIDEKFVSQLKKEICHEKDVMRLSSMPAVTAYLNNIITLSQNGSDALVRNMSF